MHYTRLEIEHLFDGFASKKVLIIGDVMIDTYYWGKVDRISPEAPVPVVDVIDTENRLGGAANVALNIKALGAKPILCSIVGNDANSWVINELLEKSDLSIEGIIKLENRPTTTKTRIISGFQQLLRIDRENNSPIKGSDEILLWNKINEIIDKVDVVIFEDYDKGCITKNIIKKTVEKCNLMGIPIAVDPKKRNFLSYKNVTLFKPNIKEIREGMNVDLDIIDKEHLFAATQTLSEKIDCEKILLTLSDKGIYFKNHKSDFILPAHVRKVADVSGAGDTVISTAALCLAMKASDHLTVELSNLAGGLVCEQLGVMPINKEILFNEALKHLTTNHE